MRLRRDFADVDGGRIGGAEDEGFHAGAGGVRGHGGAGVAVGGHGEAADAEFVSHGDGHDESAGFEGAGGEAAFVFDGERASAEAAGEFAAIDERRANFAERDDVRRVADW